MKTVNVCETFSSIQGESTHKGLPCFFIRLSGCNLRCRYCDTEYAYAPGTDTPIETLVRQSRASNMALVEVTGGEPLLQPAFPDLATALRDENSVPVLVETNGSQDISIVPERVVTIMDIKCPGSGESDRMDMSNPERLRPQDEVKFVLMDRADYDWAKDVVARYDLVEACHAVLLSPASGRLEARELGEWLVQDGLPVRLQVQLHKPIGLR